MTGLALTRLIHALVSLPFAAALTISSPCYRHDAIIRVFGEVRKVDVGDIVIIHVKLALPSRAIINQRYATAYIALCMRWSREALAICHMYLALPSRARHERKIANVQ